jgi:transposase
MKSRKHDYEKVKKMYIDGNGMPAISKKLNIPIASVQHIITSTIGTRSKKQAIEIRVKQGKVTKSKWKSRYKKIQNMYKKGMSTLEISKKFSMSIMSVYYIISTTIGTRSKLKASQLRIKQGKFKKSKWEPCYKEIQKMYNAKVPLKDIVKKFNINKTTISGIMARTTGRRCNGENSKLKPKYKKIQKLYLQGKSIKDISKLLNISMSGAYYVVRTKIGTRSILESIKLAKKQGKGLISKFRPELKNIQKMYIKGMSAPDIEKEYGAKPGSIKNLIKRTIGLRSHSTSHILARKQGKWDNAKRLKGTDSPFWIKDRTKLKNKRNFTEERNFFKEVLKERNYTCELTGKKGGRLGVHHIEPFEKNKDLRFEKSNVIVIQKKIHTLFHRVYSTIHCTKQDWDHFVANKEYLKSLKYLRRGTPSARLDQLKQEKLLPFNLKYKINLVNSVEPNILYQKVA